MHLIIGGAFQGKTDWAKAQFGLKDADILECTEQVLSDLSAKCITHLERFALCCLRQGQEPKTVLLEEKDRWKDSVLICDDISCGVVPLDAETRAWREACGRMLSALSMEAETVTRIFCGLPQRLK